MTGTRRTLIRLWIALLVLTAATLTGALVAIDAGRAHADTLRTGVAPAREGLAAARQSLVEADSAALTAFAGRARGGPGETYQGAVAAAGRQLAQVSEADLGARTTEGVQVVQSLLVTYTGLTEQAFFAVPAEPLGNAYLQYAHRLLDEEILPQLDTLRGDVDRVTPGRGGWGRHLLWIVPLLALAATLVRTQMLFARRFRRVLSVPLLAAGVLVATLGAVALLSLTVDRDVSAGHARLATLVGAYETREKAQRLRGCPALGRLSAGWAEPTSAAACTAEPPTAADRDLLATATEIGATTQRASDAARRATVAVTVLAALAAVLLTLGLRPRIEEYRFRTR